MLGHPALTVLEILAEEATPDVSLDRTQRLARAVAAKQSASEARAGVARTKRKANGIDPLAHAVPQYRHGEDAMAAHIDHSRAIGELARMQQRGELTEGVLDAIDRKENGGEKLTKIAADQKVTRGEPSHLCDQLAAGMKRPAGRSRQ